MVNTNFSIVDYLVFAFLLITSSMIGILFWFKSRNKPSNAEFLTGNRQLGLFPVTMSLVASFMSTNTLLGLPAEVYQVGTQFSLQLIGIVVAVVLAAEVFMPIYYRMALLSVNEYLAKRFNAPYIRMAGTVGFLLSTTPYMAVVLYGPALALSSVTPLSIPTSILVVGVICTFYTTIGGIKAVIWTDVLQCILMFLGVIMVIIQGVIEVGGVAEVWNINERGDRLKFFNMRFDPYNHDNFWNVVIGTTITWSAAYCVTQTQVQRYCSMGSAAKAKRTLYWNLPGLLILAILAILCGMVIYAKYHACDPITLGIIERHDQLMPYFVMDTLSKYPGLPGLFVACVFSGSLSTLSSGFNALAAITWEDIVKPRIKITSERQALNITKLIAMSYGLLAIVMSFGVGNAGTVLQASLALTGSMMGPMFALFIIGIFYPRATSLASLIGFISGISVSLVLSVGSLIIPRPKVSLPTTIDSCAAELIQELLIKPNQLAKPSFIAYYDNPDGFGRVFHISYLLMSAIGLIISLIVTIIFSYCIGKPDDHIDGSLLSPTAKYIFSFNKKQQTYCPSDQKDAFDTNNKSDIFESTNSYKITAV
ncbi:sodium-coupled monocarboxylate transporter 1-like [Oppia nitens]|uniref:sodium-coupled monocarboxylate transporter 1-like n=1 Tax=Oppia nitens TaxID=1686743 RepID=UPI0023DBF594|nr:sodium-coupled monocarboxylate transporter 1-like [Oppia nitens]